jgi:ABC-2 type transport system permease protein
MSWPAYRALVRKDLKIFRQDRRALIVTVAMPVILASFMGMVTAHGVRAPKQVDVLVADEDHSDLSRAVIAGLRGDAALALTDTPDRAAARHHVLGGHSPVAIVIPAGFGAAAPKAMAGGPRPVVSVLYDPSRQIEASIVQGRLVPHVMKAIFPSAGAEPPLPFEAHPEEITSGDAPYNGYAHSFAGMGVQFVMFSAIEAGIAILLERQRGLWKRLRAAPLSRAVILGSRATSGALIAFATMLFLFAFARLAFGVAITGSLPGFVMVCAGYALMVAALGLMIASIGKTPQATRGVSVFFVLIATMLGGAWFPAFLFPEWLQQVTFLVPTRWAVDGLDAVTWRGQGLAHAARDAAALVGFAAVFGGVAWSRFKWDE